MRRGAGGIIVRSVIESAAAQRKRRNSLLDVSVSKCADADRFVVATPVAASAEGIYALLDWADDRNKWRQTGDKVEALDKEGQRFRLVVRYMPELQFDCEVEEALKPEVYAWTCVTTPRVGHLERSHEHYRIEPVGEDQCLVTFTMTAFFEAGLDARQSAEVVRNMRVATHNAMAKLKANAEHGVGTMAAAKATRLMPLSLS